MEIWVNTKHFTVSIEVKQGIITDTAPICRWVKGHTADWFKRYLTEKNILIDWVRINDNNKNLLIRKNI